MWNPDAMTLYLIDLGCERGISRGRCRCDEPLVDEEGRGRKEKMTETHIYGVDKGPVSHYVIVSC